MRLFGWKAGVHYCPHLSDATTAWFAGVLGMPWADDGGGMVPPLGQAVCERDFSDWLAPWYNAPVEWVLLARDSGDPTAKWTPVGTSSPVTQGLNSPGRDHHPTAFTCFLAGAGVKKGFRHGATDEVGYFVAEDKVTVPDFHATILHLLGLDHEKLTFYHNGINRRLTDVHGEVVREILT